MSRELILKGWDAVLVEASEQCFDSICEFYSKNCLGIEFYNKREAEALLLNNTVLIYNYAIAEQDGVIEFYDSAGAVGTGNKNHYDIWKDYQKDFVLRKVPSLCWDTFYEKMGYEVYDFISIDVEGMDYEVLKQIDLNETKTELVSIEMTYNANEILAYLNTFTPQFSVVMANSENLIVGRNLC